MRSLKSVTLKITEAKSLARFLGKLVHSMLRLNGVEEASPCIAAFSAPAQVCFRRDSVEEISLHGGIDRGECNSAFRVLKIPLSGYYLRRPILLKLFADIVVQL